MATILDSKTVAEASKSMGLSSQAISQIPADGQSTLNQFKEIMDFVKYLLSTAKQMGIIPKEGQGFPQNNPALIESQKGQTQINTHLPAEARPKIKEVQIMPEVDKEKLKTILENLIIVRGENLPDFIKNMKVGDLVGKNFETLEIDTKIPMIGKVNKDKIMPFVIGMISGSITEIFKK